jgi:hypothetical protein
LLTARPTAPPRRPARREKWLQERRLAAVKATQATVAKLKVAADKAASAREAAAGQLARAAKAVSDCERALERERQRAALKSMKEREKEIREAARVAEKEERERRRAEALAARRYPIDDAELLAELAGKAAASLGPAAAAALASASPPAKGRKGAAPPPPADGADVPPAFDPVGGVLAAARQLPADEGRALGDLLYVSDLLASFSKPLKLKGASGADALSGALAAAGGGGGGAAGDAAGAQQWLEGVYRALLMVGGGRGARPAA